MKTSLVLLCTALGSSAWLSLPCAAQPYGPPPESPREREDRRSPPPRQLEPEQPPLDEVRITVIFQDTLGRTPSTIEVRRYQQRVSSEGWRQRELEQDLRNTREYRELTPEIFIQRTYRELLNHDPDPQTMRLYRRHMVEERWSAGQVRAAILDSDEYQLRRVDIIIDHAYEELLERKADKEGRDRYRKMLRTGMTEEELRDRLRQSVEYRVTLPDAKTIRAFRAILGHDPDAHNTEYYRKKIVDHGYTEEKIKDELRRTPEYLDRMNKKHK